MHCMPSLDRGVADEVTCNVPHGGDRNLSELTIIRSCTFDMQDTAALPQNLATEGIADAIALGAREGGGDGSAVLMIVQPGERNSYDQQARAFRCCPLQTCWRRSGGYRWCSCSCSCCLSAKSMQVQQAVTSC